MRAAGRYILLCVPYILFDVPLDGLEEVSQEIGRTRERVRQIQNQALRRLQREMERNQ